MLFFRSEDHVESWLVRRGVARGAVLTLAETWALARAWYPDRRRAEWRPRSIAESQVILDSLPLNPGQEFWTLR